ncbi:hypothetical protein BJX64DRAFT_248638 [Aspergillus heterothallicus]
MMATPVVANVDDTASFMAAARSLKLEQSYGKPPSPEPTDNIEVDEVVDNANTLDDLIELPAENNTFVENDTFFESTTPVEAAPIESAPVVEREQENRENLTTFKTWGTPAVRDTPAAQIRRVVIKGLPTSWSTPDKVLSLIHGGIIESVFVGPSGNANVLFCDPAACKAFYDKYPNGIDLDKERKFTVFVEMGKDVDVISSQLSFNLSVGATRIVRAVGVDMEMTMNELLNVATSNYRKVEKIIDSYVPNYPRAVSFRFCSIDDAVRFRAALVRKEEWEHCNVQYATDPCEVAAGYHAD